MSKLSEMSQGNLSAGPAGSCCSAFAFMWPRKFQSTGKQAGSLEKLYELDSCTACEAKIVVMSFSETFFSLLFL